MDYNSLYKEKGEMQKGVSKGIVKAAELFKKENFKKILDLGCGTGRHTSFLLENGFETFGCDFSEEAISIAKEKAPKASFEKCDMTSLPYENEFFDGIICNHVIQHGKNAEINKAVSEMQRTVRKGGIIFLVVVSTKHPNNFTGKEIGPNTRIDIDSQDGFLPHHFFLEEEITKLFKEFEILKLEHSEGSSELNPEKKSATWKLFARKVK